jgi:aldose 1-epimerase
MTPNRSRHGICAAILVMLLGPATAGTARAQQYFAKQAGEIVELQDTKNKTTVSILTTVGNIAFEMKVNGHNALQWPYESLDAYKARPGFNGMPFLGPWANRLDEQAFYANGRRYAFDMELGNVRGAIPIHGLLTFANQWKVVAVQADTSSARVTSRLEFYRNPMWIKQFPFAHTIDMTHTLKDGGLQVTTRIQNLSTDPMPVAIGFHPYFQLTDSTRDQWTVSVGAKTHWLLAENKVPTGETQPIASFFPNPKAVPLKDFDLDHVFGDLERDASGRAVMTVKGKSQELDVVVGPNYRSMVIYAPKPSAGRNGGPPQPNNFICFEPMVGITDAMNLAHKGLYKELQSIAPGGTWEESFWVRTRGF